MSGHLKAFFLLLAIGTLAILGARALLPWLEERLQLGTSDAAATKGVLHLGMDNWVGYFPLCSPQMLTRLRQAGYALRCEDDHADYQSRFERLDSGDLDLAVATVDAYLLNGAKHHYPGVIIAVIDESKGGDALLAWADQVPSLNALPNAQDLRIAFTPSSPSEHLLRSIATHFDLPALRERRIRLEANGSPQALEWLLERKAQAAVLWEPDVSRALAEPGIHKLMGSEDTDKLIVDVLLVSRRFAQDQPEAAEALLAAYFETLGYYHDHANQLRQDLAEVTAAELAQVEVMLGGVAWAGLAENLGVWFGTDPWNTGLIDAIEAARRVLIEGGEFDRDPIPDGDPYRLTNRQFLEATARRKGGLLPTPTDAADSLSRPFPPLDDGGWNQLKEIGNLRLEPIAFRRTSGVLDYEAKLRLDALAERLRRFPNFRVLIKGHTGTRGDPQANLELSLQRAAAVARYLMVTYDMDENRVRALGFGGGRPLARRPDESDRAYAYRLPRVEITLATEV